MAQAKLKELRLALLIFIVVAKLKCFNYTNKNFITSGPGVDVIRQW